ncbi:MAG: bifunctional proline dehydrogenase/L-glutamate gamma-semialdehyde dehydrogenase [Actinomycetota bacterium]
MLSDSRPDTPGGDPIEVQGDLSEVADRTVALVAGWLDRARAVETRAERRTAARLQGVVVDPAGVAFAMRFVDRVIRPEHRPTGARQLAALVNSGPLPDFLSPIDRLLLRAGARLGPILPGIVMPLAERRMRDLVGHLVVDADDRSLDRHLERRRDDRFGTNVNLLGEAVLGGREAARRHDEAMRLLDRPGVDYVSVKVSAVVAQLSPWDHEGSVERIIERLRPLLVKASTTEPRTFVNLDMEEYHDLELTVDAFTTLLDEPALHHVDAGIVLQAYLPDSFPVLQELVAWASARRRRVVDGRPGGEIKIRLVKGANLAMERVDAAMHGWDQAPYATKAETDANYKRCLDWVLTPERLTAVRIGVASHNLFDCAFATGLAANRGVADRIGLEMLEGMASAQARVARDDTGSLLLYTPAVDPGDFDLAVGYLFRRLEENAADENFIRHLFDLTPGSERFGIEAERFRTAVADRWSVPIGARRQQVRVDPGRAPAPDPTAAVQPPGTRFVNEPDTDPTLPANRRWAAAILAAPVTGPEAPLVTETAAIDDEVAVAVEAAAAWAVTDPAERRAVLHRVGDRLAARRGDLIAAMVAEGSKTVAQADPEVSEAIDFARYYADRAIELTDARARFEPLGVVLVVPPWNFPVAIPAGGVLSALAAGNAVMFKPAPETPRCAELVAECCWEAGVPPEVLRFVRTPDDEVGRHLVSHPGVDGVILTGAQETADLFRSWRPDLRLFAETSGKNALIITENADIDLAVADLVASAFGHAGQKCSAASLAVLVGDVANSPRFRRQLVDAVSSLQVGPANESATDVGPVIAEPAGKLARALTELEPGESWLVEPRRLGPRAWRPGVRAGVRPDSWFHRTECFGPVLGLIAAADLDEAIGIQNATSFGLTGGIHSLDEAEIETWLDRVQIGNAYINRGITGAIVQRQPFGGWKRSSVGPGAKAGGPNYVAQLGTWIANDGGSARDEAWLAAAIADDEAVWADHVGRDHDPTDLFCESNVFRYRPLDGAVVRVGPDVSDIEVRRVLAAAGRCGTPVSRSDATDQSAAAFAATLAGRSVERIRVLGPVEDEVVVEANRLGVHVAAEPVTASGRRELLHFVKEQAVSRSRHRYGNVV